MSGGKVVTSKTMQPEMKRLSLIVKSMSDILILNFMETLFGDLSDEDKNLIKSDI